MSNINLNLFRYFIAAAESKSFAEAGEKIGYNESTVSTSISTLEKQLGVQLFTRKPLQITEVGQEIYETVKNGFANFDFAMVIAESKNDLEYGKISVGCPSHITNFFLMDKIAEAIRDYPNMQVDLDTESDSKQLMELLKNNKIDFAILDVIPEEYLEDLEIKEIKDIDNIFVSKEEIVINNIKELENYKYILAQDNKISTRKLLEEMKKYDLKIRTILKCPTTEQRVNAAKHGIGIAYVMKEAVKEEIENNELYEIKIPIDLPKNSLKIVYLKNHLTKVDKEFIKRYLK